MKEQIKELRVKLDGLAQLTKEIVPQAYVVGHGSDKVVGFESKELTRCYDSLILAKAWLGKVLGELGAENPYKSGYKTVEDIEPTADVSPLRNNINELGTDWHQRTHIEKVDWLRQEIQYVYDSWRSLEFTSFKYTQVIYFEQHIQEAKFWLGFELQRIKENGL
jgi:hypothetical protein